MAPGPIRITIQEQYEAFSKEHPEVKIYLVALAFEVQRKGYANYGISPLWERMRWHFHIEQDLGEDFKLNNNYRSRYARTIMAENPKLEGFFRLRELQRK